VSKGLTRSRTDKLSVVGGGPAGTTDGGRTSGAATASGGGNVMALHAGGARAEVAGATALKVEREVIVAPATALEKLDWTDARAHAKAAASEKRAEARAKGYEGEACGECGNFTLVRNGTCMKCDTCGSTTGCS
jgi:ribonucleoside-diphosphate reductase alpha chain